MSLRIASIISNSSQGQQLATERSQAIRLNNNLRQLADIAEADSLSPADLKNHPTVTAAREFLNKTVLRTDEIFAECSRNWLAARLCISPNTMKNNPGFEEFAEINHFDRYLAAFHHRLTITPSKEILIQVETEKLPQHWSKIHHDPTLIKQDGKLVGRYGYKGIMKENQRNWQMLPIFQFGNPREWGCQYIFEICVRCPEMPRGLGDHVWFRLKTPKGEIYSIGMTSDKDVERKTKHTFLKVSKGFLIAPENYEFCSDKDQCLTLPIAITENQFTKIKETVESDQREKRLNFQLMQSNCVTYTCKKIGRIAGLHLFPLEQYYPSILALLIAAKCDTIMPFRKAAIITRAKKFIAQMLEMIIDRTIPRTCRAVSLNWLLLFLGATQVDKESFTKEELESVPPLISSYSDFFNPDKALFYYPHACRELIEQIEIWRKNNPGNEYAIPPQYRA